MTSSWKSHTLIPLQESIPLTSLPNQRIPSVIISEEEEQNPKKQKPLTAQFEILKLKSFDTPIDT